MSRHTSTTKDIQLTRSELAGEAFALRIHRT